MAVTSI